MTKLFKLFFLSFMSIFLVSCVQTQEIEDIGIINASGIDSTKDDSIENTLVVFQFSSLSDDMTQILTGTGKTIGGATEDAEFSAINRLVPGKIKLTIFGEDMANQGILPYLDMQARDARVPDMMYLAVGRPTAKEILSADESEISKDIGQFLHDLIENHSTDHNIPRKSLQDFLRIYYDVGQDNVLPIFEVQEKIPQQVGVALFKGDQIVGELTNNDIVLINLMDRLVKEKLFELSLPLEPFTDYLEKREQPHTRDNLAIAFFIQRGKSKTKLVDVENLTFETNTKIRLRINEQSAGIKLTDPKVIRILEKEIEKKMEERFSTLLKKVQDYGSDPFGYGRFYKKTREGKDLTVEEWREKYPNIEVKFNVEVEISRYGAID